MYCTSKPSVVHAMTWHTCISLTRLQATIMSLYVTRSRVDIEFQDFAYKFAFRVYTGTIAKSQTEYDGKETA